MDKIKGFFCFIGWHSMIPFYHPHWKYLENDGASDHVQCGWCGYKGMIDSQGNLF